jgi:hypothetical protein
MSGMMVAVMVMVVILATNFPKLSPLDRLDTPGFRLKQYINLLFDPCRCNLPGYQCRIRRSPVRSGKTQWCSTTSEDAHEAAPARSLKWYLVIAFWRWVCGTTTVTQYTFTVRVGQTAVVTEHSSHYLPHFQSSRGANVRLSRGCSVLQRCGLNGGPRQPLQLHRVDDCFVLGTPHFLHDMTTAM